MAGDKILGNNAYVNQCQVAYALHIFSYLHLRSAILMGIKLTDQQIISHHHRWRYMGYLLGIEEDLLTETIEQEKVLCHSLMKREIRPDLANDWFANSLDKTIEELSGFKNKEKIQKLYEEFKVVLVHCMGDDVLEGWGLVTDRKQYNKILKRVKRKIRLMDAVQRFKPIEALQYALVKRAYINNRGKIALAKGSKDDGNALGKVEETSKRIKSPKMVEFENIVRDMETAL
jgi:hypothetical protein